MSEELKPCPACDYTNCFQLNKDEARKFYCHCPRCGMVGPFTRTKKEAITAWNALPRHTDIKRVERERNWLAENMPNDICPAGRAECAYRCPTAGGKACYECLLCWLDAAKEAVCKNQSES